MQLPKPRLRDPFGKAGCEQEVSILKDRYEDFFFDEAPFNAPALAEYSYLIVGRRGSGKTALAKYFSFQTEIPHSRCLEVDEPTVYQKVLNELAKQPAGLRQFTLDHLARIWEVLVWSLILRHLQREVAELADVLGHVPDGRGALGTLFERLKGLIVPPAQEVAEEHLEELDGHPNFARAKEISCEHCKQRPLIIPIDTLEQFEVSNEAMMNAVGGLVEFASQFNMDHAKDGLHLKVFVSGEIFSFLMENVVLNPGKTVNDPVYLLWRPRDLLRLICWRLFKRLEEANMLTTDEKAFRDWDNYERVLRVMWVPHFGHRLTNQRGMTESSWGYVLRHTQMRPRQLIRMCNAIGNSAIEQDVFPQFNEDTIRAGVQQAERDLATEIFNSYGSVYQHAGQIIDRSLLQCPMVFPASELDRRARRGASLWEGDYSPAAFRRLVAELGVVGRVLRRNDEGGYIDAEFEYSTPERLTIGDDDECAIHPMFYRRLKVNFNVKARVMPFSSQRVGGEVRSE